MASFTERHEHQLEIIPPFSIIQCRRADIIEKDGVEVGRTYHRHCWKWIGKISVSPRNSISYSSHNTMEHRGNVP